MQSELKVNEIFIRLSKLITLTTQYNKDDALYCDYNAVIQILDAAADIMSNHHHMSRLSNIPDDVQWPDAYSLEDWFAPFTYRGETSIEDYEKMRKAYDFTHQDDNEVIDSLDYQNEKKAEESAHAEEETET